MAGIAQSGHKCLIFIVVPLLRLLKNIKERWRKKKKKEQEDIFKVDKIYT